MTLIKQLLRLADTYCQSTGLSKARVSTLVFNDGKVLANLDQGKDITTSRLEGALRWFDHNWPANAAWPIGVIKPATPEPGVTHQHTN